MSGCSEIDVEKLQRVLLHPVSSKTAAWLIGSTPEALRIRRKRIADKVAKKPAKEGECLRPIVIESSANGARTRIGYRIVDLLRFTIERLNRLDRRSSR